MPGDKTQGLSVRIDEKAFGATPILGPIAFAAAPGEFLAMLAPSGTGKTTALRIILGLDTGFSGTVTLPQGRLGTMFQEPRLLPWLDVAGNLRLAVPTLSDADIESLLASLGLPGTAAKLPRQISLGMARRVSLARALAVQPKLLVLDEPFASLDTRLAAQLAAIVAASARGAIAIMATHDLDQALVVASRVLVLAGKPALLAADMQVPAVGERPAFAASLRARFPFLAASPPTQAEFSSTSG
jgi:NitT/TauT family transport system ATP-binding protein